MSPSCPACGYVFECPCGCQSCPRCGPPGPAPRVAGAIARGLADARTARLFGAEQSPDR